jgi:hypothetical protein
MNHYARANIRDGIPPTHPQLSDKDLCTLLFKSMTLDEADGHSIIESDHPEGFNMLILHPVTHCIHWAYTHDFDWVEFEEED